LGESFYYNVKVDEVSASILSEMHLSTWVLDSTSFRQTIIVDYSWTTEFQNDSEVFFGVLGVFFLKYGFLPFSIGFLDI
jgi:hypothetical protein